jgi:deazaflavin-dependent oxidoreductase (nitroreductase family)
VRIRRSDDG